MKPAAPQSIDFDQIPPAGTVVMYRGQRYEAVGFEPYIRRDGIETTLIRWATHCARCADPMVVTTTRRNQPNRRCRECARPGRRA